MATKTTWTKEDRERFFTILETTLLAALALVAIWLLEIDLDKIASISAPQWALMATGVAGVVVAFRNALRGSVRRSPATSEPPPRSSSEGFVDVEVLAGIAVPGMLVLLAVATLAGCESAVAAYARAGTVMSIALEGADELAETGAEAALEACPDIDCTVRVEHTTVALDAAIASTNLVLEAYVRAVQLALAGGGTADVVAALGLGIGRLVLRWNELVPLFVPLGVELPAIPPWVAVLAGGRS